MPHLWPQPEVRDNAEPIVLQEVHGKMITLRPFYAAQMKPPAHWCRGWRLGPWPPYASLEECIDGP